MINTILGGIIGIIATTIGVLLTYYTGKQKEKSKRRECKLELLKTIRIDLDYIKTNLTPESGIIKHDTSVYSLILSNSILTQIPIQTANSIIKAYSMVRSVNEGIDSMNLGINAFIASGASEKFGNINGLRENVEEYKLKAIKSVNEALQSLNNYTNC